MLDHTDFGTTLLDEILPYHLEYYLGIKKEYGGGNYGDLDDESDGDKGSGSESSGSEKPKKKNKKPEAPKAAGGAPKQECK